MFDTITVKMEGFPQDLLGVELQTKDIYKAMDEYMVNPEGELFRLNLKRRVVKDKKSPVGFRSKEISRLWLRKTDLHDTVTAIGTVKDKLVTVELTFCEGRLVKWKRKRIKK
jgi:hypothetical protein